MNELLCDKSNNLGIVDREDSDHDHGLFPLLMQNS